MIGMKKILISCLFLFAFSITTSTLADAAPKKIEFNTPATERVGGSVETIVIIPEDDGVQGNKIVYDIGVSKQIISGRITQFKILSTETVPVSTLLDSNFRYDVKIPNPLEAEKGDTYVVYVKSYYLNNPDSERLAISQPFKITGTDKAFAEFVAGAVLLNTGRSHAFNTGPTIYREALTSDYATSAKLVLNINSNTDFTINPKITFTKLRSSSFKQDVPVPTIEIKKGINVKVIDLPNFDYVSGVYTGVLELNASKDVGLIKTINFQYIVDGPFVSVGQVNFAGISDGKYAFNMETFGKPLDTLTPGRNYDNIATTTETYRTTFDFLDIEGKVAATVDKTLDYNQSLVSFDVLAGKVKHAKSVNIKVYDSQNKIFFETTQDLNLPIPKRDVTNALYTLCILLLGIALYMMTHRKWILVISIVLGLLCGAVYVWAAPWTPSPNSSDFNQYHRMLLTFDRDYSNEYLSCSETTDMLVKINIRTCNNGVDTFRIGTSRISNSDAKNHTTIVDYVNDPSKTFEKYLDEGGGQYSVFNYSLPFVKIDTLQGPIASGAKVYIYLKASTVMDEDYESSNPFFDESWSREASYVVNLKATPTTGPGSCDRCTNLDGEQSVPTFTARSRNYFYQESDGTLYFAPSSQTLPGVCTKDMCADTDTNESDIPSDKMWDTSKPTAYERTTCVPKTTEVCSCVGRNKVCMNGAVQTSNAPDASCNLDATCTYPMFNPSGSVTFTYSATNVLGTLVGGGSFATSVPSTGSGTISETRTLSNTGDGQTDTATCSYDYVNLFGGDPTCTPGSPGCCPADFVGPCGGPGVQPVVVSFTASKIVDKGRDCVFTWDTTDFDECKLSGELVGLDGTESFSTVEGKNITKTLACTLGGSAAYPTYTATCLVRPTVNEQ